MEARLQAWAPYSGFAVGAALEAGDGRVFVGCNVENASYGLTQCAERNAVAAAVVGGARRFVRLALSTEAEVATPPCGACRQVLAEFAPDLVIVSHTTTHAQTWRLEELLPVRFDLKEEAGIPGSGHSTHDDGRTDG